MKIKTIFNRLEDVSLTDYLQHCGIEDSEAFIKGKGTISYSIERKAEGMQILYDMKLQSNKIYVLVDPDGDGYSSAAIVKMALKGWDIVPLFHSKKQHGIDQEIIDAVEPNSLIIIPDASVDNKWEEALDEKNIKTWVIDHHPIEEGVNDLLNNNHYRLNNNDEPQSGSMVTYKFFSHLDASGKLKELACMGNMTDVMPQNYIETRVLNKSCAYPKHKFIAAMLDKYTEVETFCPKATAFGYGPKINACIRSTNQGLKEAMFNALWTEEFDEQLLIELDNNHTTQKSYVRNIVKNMDIDTSNNIIIAITPHDDNIVGLNGLLANRIMMLNNKPVLAVTLDEDTNVYRGSLRSPVDLKTILQQTELFSKAQGHERACGVDFDAGNAEKIIEKLNNMTLVEDEVEVLTSIEHDEFNDKLFRLFNSEKDYWGEQISTPLIHIKPFKINLKNFSFTNKFKSDVRYTMRKGRTYYDIERTFISKINRLNWKLGQDQWATIEMIGSVKYDGKYKKFEVEDWEIRFEDGSSW